MSNVSKKLSNGAWVLLRPIPPHYRVAPDVMGELPPEPEAPMKMLESVDGHTESTPAVEGDPQYTAYLVERATWLHDCTIARRRLQKIVFHERLDFGIVGWVQPGPLASIKKALGLWSRKEPVGWKPHRMTKRHGTLENRIAYVVSELLVDDDDYDIVIDVLMPEPGKGDSPLTSSEVDAQLDGFQPDDRGDEGTAEGSDTGA